MHDNTVEMSRLQEMYGLNPNMPHMALQFPRLPPGLTHPMFKVYENPTREKMVRDATAIAQKMTGFQHMYQEHAAGLLNMNNTVVPPGHPLYHRANSIQTLETENKKLLKENSDLKRMLKDEKDKRQEPDSNHHPGH